jgi:hypothetical protein
LFPALFIRGLQFDTFWEFQYESNGEQTCPGALYYAVGQTVPGANYLNILAKFRLFWFN